MKFCTLIAAFLLTATTPTIPALDGHTVTLPSADRNLSASSN